MRKLAWVLIAAMILQSTQAVVVHAEGMAGDSLINTERSFVNEMAGGNFAAGENPGEENASADGNLDGGAGSLEGENSNEGTSSLEGEDTKEGTNSSEGGNPGEGAGSSEEGNLGEGAGSSEEENPGEGAGSSEGENPGEETGSSEEEAPGEGEIPGEDEDPFEESGEGQDSVSENTTGEEDESETISENDIRNALAAGQEEDPTPLTDETIQLLSFEKYYSEGNGYPVMAGIAVPLTAFGDAAESELSGLEMSYVRLAVDGGEAARFDVVNKRSESVKKYASGTSTLVGYALSGFFGYNKAILAGEHTLTYEFVFKDSGSNYYSVTRMTAAEFIDEAENGEVIVSSGGTESTNRSYMSGKAGAKIYKIPAYFNWYKTDSERIKSVTLRNHETGISVQTETIDVQNGESPTSLSRDQRYYISGSLNGASISVSGGVLLPKDIYTGDSSSFTVRLQEDIPEGYYDVVFTTTTGRKLVRENDYYATVKPVVLDVYGTNTRIKEMDDQGAWRGVPVAADNTGNYVSVFVYGFNLTGDNVPVFYRDSERTDPITHTLSGEGADAYTGYEEHEYGVDFCVRKMDASDSVWSGLNTSGGAGYSIRVQGEEVYELNHDVWFNSTLLTRVEYGNQEKPNLPKCVRFYLNPVFVKQGTTIYVKVCVGYYPNRQEYTASGRTKQKEDEYYVEFGASTDIYKKMVKEADITVSVDANFSWDSATSSVYLGDANGETAELKPAYLNSLSVPSGGRWEIHPANQVAKTVYSGNTSGSSVLDGEMLETLASTGKQYRVCTYNADGSVNTRRMAFFYNTNSAAVTGVTLNTQKAYMAIGDSLQLTATVKPDNAVKKTVTWASDNPAVAQVDPETGMVNALTEGRAVITATAVSGGKKAQCQVVVLNPVGRTIEFDLTQDSEDNPLEESIAVNEAYKADAKYESADTSVATVTAAGIVSPAGIGETTVWAKLGDVRIEYAVIVRNPLTGIAFEGEDEEKDVISLEIGEVIWKAVIFTPAYTTDSKELTVSSSDESVAAARIAGRNVRIEGLKEGEAKITASVNTGSNVFTAECNVRVEAAVQVPEIEAPVYALTNYHSTLADVENQLPDGFRFEDPTIKFSSFAGASEQEFAVIYTGQAGGKEKTAESVCKVRFLTVTGLELAAVLSAVAVGNSGTLQVKVQWSGYNDAQKRAEYLKEYTSLEVISKNPDIANVSGTEVLADGSLTYQGWKAGKASFEAVLRKKGSQGTAGILFKKTAAVQVTAEAAETVRIVVRVNGEDWNEAKGYYTVQKKQDGSENVTLEAAVESGGDYTLRWSSSDTSIAAVGRTTGTTTPLTVKSAGPVRLTVTANDKAKTNESILFNIVDGKPGMDSAVTVNMAMTDGAPLGIFPGEGFTLNRVELRSKTDQTKTEERFDMIPAGEQNQYQVTVKDTTLKTGKYEVLVRTEVTDGEGVSAEYYEPLSVSVVNKPAAYTMKQVRKVNLFYKDQEGAGLLTISGKTAELTGAVLTGCGFDYDMATGMVSYQGTDPDSVVKQGVMLLTFAGYKPVNVNVTIATETRQPKITMSAASTVLYPNAGTGIREARIQLFQNGTLMESLSADEIRQGNLSADKYKVAVDDNDSSYVCYSLKDGEETYPKSAKITFALQRSNWNKPVNVTHTVKSSQASKPTLKLSSSTITLNKNSDIYRYQNGTVAVKVKDCAGMAIDSVSLAGTDWKSRSALNTCLDFRFDKTTGQLEMWFNRSSDTTATYTYNLSARVAGTTATAKLKVKVVDKKVNKDSIAVSARGKIDLLDRGNSAVTVTPKFAGLPGTVTGARLTGRDAHLFRIEEPNEKGVLTLRARMDASYFTKYPYQVSVLYTLLSGGRYYTVSTKEMKIQVTQGKAKISASLSNGTWYRTKTSGNSLDVNLAAVNARNETLKITEVSVVESAKMKGVFAVEYDAATGECRLLLPDATKVKKNTYTVKLSLHLENQADNEKDKTVSVKVKVK